MSHWPAGQPPTGPLPAILSLPPCGSQNTNPTCHYPAEIPSAEIPSAEPQDLRAKANLDMVVRGLLEALRTSFPSFLVSPAPHSSLSPCVLISWAQVCELPRLTRWQGPHLSLTAISPDARGRLALK